MRAPLVTSLRGVAVRVRKETSSTYREAVNKAIHVQGWGALQVAPGPLRVGLGVAPASQPGVWLRGRLPGRLGSARLWGRVLQRPASAKAVVGPQDSCLRGEHSGPCVKVSQCLCLDRSGPCKPAQLSPHFSAPPRRRPCWLDSWNLRTLLKQPGVTSDWAQGRGCSWVSGAKGKA